MNDHRDHDRPFSADSSKNVPGRLAASLRYADSGVSLSASTLRVTGTNRCSAASARKSSRDVVIARSAVVCTGNPPRPFADATGRSVTPMKRGDLVDEFELPDQTGTCASSRAPGRRPGRAVLLSRGDDARLHQGGMPLPRPGKGIRRRRRVAASASAPTPWTSRRSSPTSKASTTRCCRTPTAPSRRSSA